MHQRGCAVSKGELIAPADEEVVDPEGDVQDSHDSEHIEIQDEVEEAEPLKIAPSPKQPSAADVELHRITHWPYRSWCEECVKGSGLGEQRGTHVGRAHEVPIVGVDYFYMTEKGLEHRSDMALSDAEVKTARECGDIVLCLIIRCYATKNVFCHVVPCKGDDQDKFVFNLAVDDIGWLGHTRVILKSDQERSLVSLVTST